MLIQRIIVNTMREVRNAHIKSKKLPGKKSNKEKLKKDIFQNINSFRF